jgi:hypothetical protein
MGSTNRWSLFRPRHTYQHSPHRQNVLGALVSGRHAIPAIPEEDPFVGDTFRGTSDEMPARLKDIPATEDRPSMAISRLLERVHQSGLELGVGEWQALVTSAIHRIQDRLSMLDVPPRGGS